jgi:hypothetical protein
MQLEQPPLELQLICMLHESLEIDTDGIAGTPVKKSILFRDIRPARHCPILKVNQGRAKCHQHSLEIWHETLKICHYLSAPTQDPAANSPFRVLRKAMAKGVEVLAPYGIEVSCV